jgi:hypothetical protein
LERRKEMSIADFDKLIDEIKANTKDGKVSEVLHNIIAITTAAQECNKKGLRYMQDSIRYKMTSITQGEGK